MTQAPPERDGGRAYAREIERRWAQLQGRPVVLSPKDWVLITDWHARGIPLSLVDEAIQAAGERRRELPRNLAYVVPAVEEAWGVVVDGRRRDEPLAPPRALAPREAWRRVAREHSGTPLGALLDGLLARLEGGEPVEAIETTLERELTGFVDPALLSRIRREIERELAPFSERLSGEIPTETTRAAVVFRLRRELGLPGLGRA